MVNWNLESDGSMIIEDKKCRAPPMHITVIRKTAVRQTTDPGFRVR